VFLNLNFTCWIEEQNKTKQNAGYGYKVAELHLRKQVLERANSVQTFWWRPKMGVV